MIEEAAGLFDLLEPVEHYWAFPGVRRFEQARRMFAAGDYGRFARCVARLNRGLATDEYRRVLDLSAPVADDACELGDAVPRR